MGPRTASFVCATLVLALFLQGTAVAGDERRTRTPEWEVLAREAKQLADEGRYVDAIERLRKAYAIRPVAGLLYNIGRLYEKSGAFREARAAYEDCRARDPGPEIRRRVDEGLARVAAALAVGRLTLDVSPPGALVFVDGAPVGNAPLAPLELPTGSHRVRVEHPGHVPFETAADVPGAGATDLHVSLHEVLAAAGTDEPSTVWDFALALSFAEGVLVRGADVRRTHVSVALRPSFRVGWLRIETAVALTLESPVSVLLRPGFSFDVGPMYLRAAGQVLVHPYIIWGGLAGVGARIPLASRWSLLTELDAGLLSESVVTIELRLGAAYVF